LEIRKLKVSDYVSQRLSHLGVEACFMVTGGGAMHLNDSLAGNDDFVITYNHHEQACAMAAEGYARVAGKPAVVCATTGPGALNTFNGVFGAYTDSVPMIILAGQVKKETISTEFPNSAGVLRQLGDQEVRSIRMVKEITKGAWQILDANSLPRILDDAFELAISGRPGPVWVEIPVDIQGLDISADPQSPFLSTSKITQASESSLKLVLEKLLTAKRPVILAGSGVRISNTQDSLLRVAEFTNTPVVTAWTHDIFDNSHRLFAGRAGTIGTRPGNFSIQNADLVLVLGSRLNVRQVSYNWASFAKGAEKIWVDVDSAELAKPFPDAAIKICADLRSFLPKLADLAATGANGETTHKGWIAWIRKIHEKFSVTKLDYKDGESGINPYHFVMQLFDKLTPNHVVVTGNATACIVPFQVGYLKQGTRLFSNSGSASMGFDLPAALGASVAAPNRPVICLAGDGSLMMNIQELATLAGSKLNVGVVVLDNGGYLSIKQTQKNFFGRESGSSSESGVYFPSFTKVAAAFDLPVYHATINSDWDEQIRKFLDDTGPRVLVADLEESQEFEPRLKSRQIDGLIQTPELDDMFPHLAKETLKNIRISAVESEIRE
jgi:acetolactate synthase-1/2/3 large subunit